VPSGQGGRPDDIYIVSMMQDQARQFLTEGDNRIHTPRLPSAYRRALMPDPQGQARAGVAYFEAEIVPTPEELERENEGLFEKMQRLAGMLWRRFIAPQPRGYGEARDRLLDDW
jgi:hypothetical protein